MHSGEPITLALVEDDERIRGTLMALFAMEPSIRVTGAFADAERARAELPALAPQVVLMDIGLPGMDGIACVGELSQRMPGTQFMMYTVHDADERVFEALKAGANGYLLKNSSAEQIVKAVHELMNGGAPMSTLVARRIIGHFHNREGERAQAHEPLSEREKHILELLARGLIYKEIADEMGISVNTVGQHVHRIYRKLHVQTRIEAVNKYFGK
jgi:DNA-binding NarL/FixJ family response regulator